nr:hypothetical protein [uncultured Pseudomonas sp.]
MEEIFVVQKRPTVGEDREGFYYRVVNSRTGERLYHSYREQSEAERHCHRLNSIELKVSLVLQKGMLGESWNMD